MPVGWCLVSLMALLLQRAAVLAERKQMRDHLLFMHTGKKEDEAMLELRSAASPPETWHRASQTCFITRFVCFPLSNAGYHRSRRLKTFQTKHHCTVKVKCFQKQDPARTVFSPFLLLIQ